MFLVNQLFVLIINEFYQLMGIEKVLFQAIQKHFSLTNYQMLIIIWIKGVWTGILLSLVLHYLISH